MKNFPIRLGLFLLLFLGAHPNADAQLLRFVQGELLIRFHPGVDPKACLADYRLLRSRNTQVRADRCISDQLGIWSVRFDWTRIDEYEFLEQIKADPRVEDAQFNHFLNLRSAIPNDPFYNNQWHLHNTGQEAGGQPGTPGVDLGMEQAWDITTGGVTPNGDTIVVCVIDNGLDTRHEDFADNVWINRREIPGNGLDDDENGYVDDYFGWNVIRQNDKIDEHNFHGTLVAGIIGAKGNNGLGVTGINWNVKLMIVVGGFGSVIESRIIEGYAYAMNQRKLYNATNGEKGAYVVATNASWGLDQTFASEFPLWCAVYDSLGKYGILNVTATSNENINVDVEGDMPSNCSSDFLLAVTNVDNNGEKVPDAGYGQEHIDLGAFGEFIYTTDDGNNYGYDFGTSFSTPMVTGAIGLLYASPCPTLSVIAQTSPAEAALLVKDLLLRSVVAERTLEGLVATGGRLHIYQALALLEAECGTCPPLVQVRAESVTDTRADLYWVTNDSTQKVDLRWRAVGDPAWTVLENAVAPVALEGLDACRQYEFALRTYCNTDTLDYGTPTVFRTDGCCEPPEGISVVVISETEILLRWNPVLAAEGYQIRYREVGATDWIATNAFGTTGAIRNLSPCTEYEYQMTSVCSGAPLEFGRSHVNRTRGCGACLEANYCIPSILDEANAQQEWIASVKLHELVQPSGQEGYGDFTGRTPSTHLLTGATYPIELEPAFSGFAFGEYFTVWIDYNQDGFFTSDEIAFDPGEDSDSTVTGMVTIPENARLGATRMRVAMQFRNPPSACGFGPDYFGEVEDYCVEIVDAVNNVDIAPPPLAGLSVFPNPTRDLLQFSFQFNGKAQELQYEVFRANGQRVAHRRQSLVMRGEVRESFVAADWTPGIYFLSVSAGTERVTRKFVKY